jgi:hypothetical protein
MAWLENHAIGGHVERLLVDLNQRPNNRRDQIRAASDRLGEYHIGAATGVELFDDGGQFIEVAAKAGPSDFPDIESLGP